MSGEKGNIMEDIRERIKRLREQGQENDWTTEDSEESPISSDGEVGRKITSQNYRAIGEEKDCITITGDRITYNATGKSYDFSDPEEKVRTQVYVELIEVYKYPPGKLDTEARVDRRPPYPADIVVYEEESKKTYIIVEAKCEDTVEMVEGAKEQGLSNATIFAASFLLIACGSQRLAYDVSTRPSLKELEKYRIPDIPVAYGKVPEYRYVKGEPQRDLQEVDFRTLEQWFRSCHNEIWGGGERDPALAFDEMSKLLFAKIYDEGNTKTGQPYKFQVGTFEKNEVVAQKIRELYTQVQDKEPNLFKEGIKLPDQLICSIVRRLQHISFTTTDLDAKGRAYEEFLGDIFRGEYGQYFTRRQIVEFMVDMLEPTQDDVCIDPACGSGGFLLYTMDRVIQKAEVDYVGDNKTINDIAHSFPRKGLFGIEINDRIIRIAMMDMVIHGDGHDNIENADALSDPETFDRKRDIALGKYTLLLTNPPFGSKVKNREILDQYDMGRGRTSQRSEILFIERCLDFLKPGGRMGIVLPDNILTNSPHQYVRDFILEKARILAIVSLPQDAFASSGTAVKTSLLFLQKEKSGEDYPIFMAVTNSIGYDNTGRTRRNELPEIVGEYRKSLHGEEKFNLGIVVRRGKLGSRFDPQYYSETSDRFKSKYELRRLAELVDYIKEGFNPGSAAYVDQDSKSALYLRVRSIKEHEVVVEDHPPYISEELFEELKEYQPQVGEILLTKDGTIGRAVLVLHGLKAIINTGIVRIAPKSDINPYYLVAALNSSLVKAQVERDAGGITIKHLHISKLRNIQIPVPPLEVQTEIGSMVEEAYRKRDEAQESIKGAEQEIEEMTTGGEYLIEAEMEDSPTGKPKTRKPSKGEPSEQELPNTLSQIAQLRAKIGS